MSLKITRAATFAALAHVSLPTDKPGVFNEGSFTCRFNHLPDAEVTAFLDGTRDLGTDDQPARVSELLEYQRAFLDRALASVEGIADDSGNLSPEDQRTLVINTQALWLAALNAFIETYGGARSKNSKPSRKR